jgi:5-methylcytosine-specific restriction protein A
VDHKTPGDDHGDDNLGAVHDRNYPHCHRYKSSREGNAARWRVKNSKASKPHPGLLS